MSDAAIVRWTTVCTIDEIESGRGIVRHVNGAEIALMRDGEAVFAVGNACPHRGGQLGDGKVSGGRVICPLHGWDFDLATGISPFNPADSVPAYPTRVHEGQVQVDSAQVPQVPRRPAGYLSAWTRRGATDRGMYLVHHLAEGAGPFVEAMGSERFERGTSTRPGPSLDDIVFVPAQLDRLPLLGSESVDTSTILGTRAARPLHLAIPVFVSHMSFGALSAEAKEALAKGSAMAGTAIASGEGGMHPRERGGADRYIFEMASGYFGWDDEHIRQADAIEVKIGQGAKPGLGGTLPGSKVTAEIAAVRGVEPGTTVHSPAHFPDINSVADLRARVDEIRGVAAGIPIGIKFASGHVERDVAAALEAGADWITIDGMGGGTGAAPTHVKDHVGLPSPFALYRARRFLDEQGVDDVQLIVTGGFRTPDEIAKAIALGADAVALATASLMAIGCQQYRACHSGGCPVGIATQVQALRSRLEVDTSAERLANFLRGATAMLCDYARICGRDRVTDLGHADIATLDHSIATSTDLRWVL